MTAISAKTIKNYQHPAFDGLSDKALMAFYSLGNIETLEPGGMLFRPEDKATDSFLILGGRAALLSGKETQVLIHQFNEGAYLPLALYHKDGTNRYGLLAAASLSLFRFSEVRLTALDPELQLLITRNLAKLANTTAEELLQQQAGLASGKQLLAQQLLEEKEEQLAYYSASKPILSLLGKIPRLPSYATRLTQMLSDQNVSAKEAFETAKLDPSLTASVLKTVNSAAYGLKHKVMDFQHAFLLLGFNQIQQIIINRGIQSTMPKAPEFQQLQLHCVMVSALCQEIAQTVKQGNPAVLGTIGLLHDIGRSVVMLLKREHEQLSFLINLLNADLIGTLLLREWQIPEDLSSCMQYQSLPYQAPPYVIPEAHRSNMAILYVAHLCFDFLMEKPAEAKQLRFFADYMKTLGCSSITLEDFMRDVLLPSVQTRINSLPKVIQNFLKKGLTLTAHEGDKGHKLDLELSDRKTADNPNDNRIVA